MSHHEHKHEHKGKTSEKFLDKQAVLKALDIKQGQSILDAGCGDGYMTKEFAKLVGDRSGILDLAGTLTNTPTSMERR